MGKAPAASQIDSNIDGGGRRRVVLQRASGLPETDLLGSCDPYVKLQLGSGDSELLQDQFKRMREHARAALQAAAAKEAHLHPLSLALRAEYDALVARSAESGRHLVVRATAADATTATTAAAAAYEAQRARQMEAEVARQLREEVIAVQHRLRDAEAEPQQDRESLLGLERQEARVFVHKKMF